LKPEIQLLLSPNWSDYELLDSGHGRKLERFGPYTFVRPEHQAIWHPALPDAQWQTAQAVFQPTGGDEMGGHWQIQNPVEAWIMEYRGLKFQARLGGSRHVGVFPEQATHWDWMDSLIRTANRPVQVLNLFGYTGLASLAAARAGAKVTHVDASKKSIAWARENQILAGLSDRPIRWILDDAMKFVQREGRRQVKYDGILLDPPKFGRGPRGEVWECLQMLPGLLEDCRAILSEHPLFVVVTAYAIRASALSLYSGLEEMMTGLGGHLTAGELVIEERSAGRVLSAAIYARWSQPNQSVVS
jgi:23S rRNA (cytosine1962-C5)-methyltransferase